DDGDCVCVTVRDSGVGFDPRDMEKLFKSFFTTKPQGMGIGLSVSRSIIENHHGRLWAAVNQGPGATFAFAIPRSPAPHCRGSGGFVIPCRRPRAAPSQWRPRAPARNRTSSAGP